jgi:outer membrane receptor protein involved in Fe transport
MRLGGESKLNSRWLLSGSATYAKSGGSRMQGGSNLSGIMLGLLRTPISFDNTGGFDDAFDVQAAYVLPDGTPRAYRPTIYDSPYWIVNRVPYNDDVNRVLTSVALTYKPNDWFSILYRPGVDMYSDRRSGGYDIFSGQHPDGQVFEDQHNFYSFSGDLIASFNKKLSEKFDGALIVGNNMYASKYEQLYTQGDIMSIPSFYQISNSSSVISRDRMTRVRTAAFYADAKLDYKKMLYLDATVRNEWSTTLPGKTYLYPSVSLGFIFTEALKLSDNKTFPYGKFRINWANVGNDAAAYSTQARVFNLLSVGDGWTTGIGSPFEGNTIYTLAKTAGNPDLEPTNSTSIEAGVELKFIRNRIGIDFTYYNTDTKNGIFQVPVASSSGLQAALFNAGKINNKGMEILLNLSPVQTKNFKWDIILNWSKNTSEVVELIEGVESINLGGFETPSSRLVVGQPYGVIYGGRWLRDPASGEIVIDDQLTNADGSTNDNYGFPIVDPEEGKIGDPNPDWTGGLRNTLSFKGFTLTALLDIRKGGDIWNGTEGAIVGIGTSKATENRGEDYVFPGVMGHQNADGTLAVSGTNDIHVVRDEAWYRAGNGSGFGPVGEQFIQDGGWTRLREVGLSYTFGKKWVGQYTPFASIEFGVSGRNLWLDTEYTGVDPETNLTGSGAFRAFGFEYFNNPNTKSYTFSLRVTL